MSKEGSRGAMLWEATVNQDGYTGLQWKYFWKGWQQDGTLTPEQVELRAQARSKQRHVTQRRVHAQRVLAQGGYGGAWGPRQREVLAALGDEAVSEALADRIVQLSRLPQVVASVTGDDKGRASLDYQWEAWWGQWQYLGDIVFHGVEAGLIDIDKLTKRVMRRGVQDNAIIWIIGQCTQLDKMKTLSTHDLISALMTATIKFFNDKQCEDGALFEPREVPLCWLWGRPSAALNAEIKKHAHKQIEKHIQHISELYKQLFQDIKQSGNFRKVDVSLQNKICAFSSQGFQQVFNLFENNLKVDIEHHQNAVRAVLTQLPPNVTTYSPPIATLPAPLYSTSFLATLALRCRYRLIMLLENTLGNAQLDTVPLSALEMYVRLVYYLPGQSYQVLLEHYYKAEQARLHMLTELFTHRLYRFMVSHDMHDHLLNHVLRHLAVTTHAQNYDALQSLALRLTMHLHDPYYFTKKNELVSVPEPLDDTRHDYGEAVNRMLTLALARTIKLRGLRDMQRVPELYAHLTQLHHLTGHVWPVETSALFPKVVQSFYQDKARIYLPTNSDRVNEELRLVMSLNEAQLREYFAKEEKQLYLLPILLRAHPVISPSTVLLLNKLHVNELMNTITPQRWSKLTYWLLDYLLDTLTAEQLASGGEVNSDQLELTAQKLSHLIWDHAVLSLHTVLMALADSLVLPRALDTQHNAAVNRFNTAIQLIEYLLCKDPTILACREAFIALQPNVDHWREDEPHKLREFLSKFPARYVRTAANTPMTSYYSNTYLSVLPVLDYLIGRLIEVDQTDFLNYLMEHYSTLYRYHPAALTFLYETLFYYYEAPAFSSVRPDTSGKLIFFQLLVQSKVSFTSHLLHQFLQNMSEIDLTEQYFNDLLATLHIIDQGAEASMWTPFEELGGVNTVQHQYTCAAIELMAVTNAANPRTPLWIFTPQQLVQWPKQLGKLFAFLPRAFQDEFERQLVLYYRSIRDSLLNGCSWAWRWQEASSMDHVTFFVPAHSSVAHSDATVSNIATVSMSAGTTEERLLWLVHSYYSLASPDTLLNYVTLLRQIRDVDPISQRANQPINSVAQLLLLVKSIAPYLPVLAKTPDQEYLQAVLVELLSCFKDGEHFMDSVFSAGYTADRDNELLDIITDFFLHCKAALQLSAPVIEAMRGVIRGLNIELRRRFKGI